MHSQYPIVPFNPIIRPHLYNEGIQYLFSFPSGYGTSIVKNKYSYGGPEGKYELAVLHKDYLIYNTPITNDVIGWLTLKEAFYITTLVSKFTNQPNNPHMRKSRLAKQIKKLNN